MRMSYCHQAPAAPVRAPTPSAGKSVSHPVGFSSPHRAGRLALQLNATAALLPFANPEGVLSVSPGLRGTSYPGFPACEGTNPERVASCRPATRFGAGPRYNPFRVEGVLLPGTQGSSFLATLGWTMESRWDSQREHMKSVRHERSSERAYAKVGLASHPITPDRWPCFRPPDPMPRMMRVERAEPEDQHVKYP
jgi:hypothetical protein